MEQDERPSGEQEYQPVTHEDPSGGQGEQRDDVPNPETGVGLSMGEASSFEPEEDPEAAAGSDDPSEQASPQ